MFIFSLAGFLLTWVLYGFLTAICIGLIAVFFVSLFESNRP